MEVMLLDRRALEKAKRIIPKDGECYKISGIFKALGDPNRLKVVKALTAGELCSSDVAQIVEMENSTVSHQLKYLKTSGIISSRKEGKFIYYKVENECVKKLFALVEKHLLQCE